MGTPQYIISSVVLEEHRHNVEHHSPNPDWPEPVSAHRTALFAGARQTISDVLFALAERLEPASERSRSGTRETWVSEPMR